jgi:hypothetical protein
MPPDPTPRLVDRPLADVLRDVREWVVHGPMPSDSRGRIVEIFRRGGVDKEEAERLADAILAPAKRRASGAPRRS